MVSFFTFGLKGHKKLFWILSSSHIILVGTFDINERKTIFKIAKVLKTMILPSSVRWCIRQTFKTFWFLVMLSRIFFFISIFFAVRKLDSSNFYGIITQINTLHATYWHFHTFQLSNTCSFTFLMIWFQTWMLSKCSKCINKFLNRSFVS